ncbi:hypothetical protein LINPERPRIM_LOCUS35928 [Linum perenne]
MLGYDMFTEKEIMSRIFSHVSASDIPLAVIWFRLLMLTLGII